MRLTDKRFSGDGFYQPKDRFEMKEIILMNKPSCEEIYKKLYDYENTEIEPFDINNIERLTFKKLSAIIKFGTPILIYEDIQKTKLIWSGVFESETIKNKLFCEKILQADVKNLSMKKGAICIEISQVEHNDQ